MKQSEPDLWNFPDIPKPPPPYPLRQKKVKYGDQEFNSFVELMKKVNLNITLFELFSNVPKYAKFFKDMLANKEKFREDDIVPLSASCSCIIKKDIQLPQKQKDPRSCTIPCSIGSLKFEKSLCD